MTATIKGESMTEPMKCANCGESIVQMMSRHWYHEFTGFQECRLYAKPMNGITGIKSEDTKPVERPPLPTSREWLESDGEMGDYGNSCYSSSLGNPCLRTFNHEGWHTSVGGAFGSRGRWYTDDPFVEAK